MVVALITGVIGYFLSAIGYVIQYDWMMVIGNALTVPLAVLMLVVLIAVVRR